jgi:hypothetical protein
VKRIQRQQEAEAELEVLNNQQTRNEKKHVQKMVIDELFT